MNHACKDQDHKFSNCAGLICGFLINGGCLPLEDLNLAHTAVLENTQRELASYILLTKCRLILGKLASLTSGFAKNAVSSTIAITVAAVWQRSCGRGKLLKYRKNILLVKVGQGAS